MNCKRLYALLAWLPLAALSGCGGGNGGDTGFPVDRGIEGSGQSITSAGVVTAKGSIFVNDVEYDLTGAEITIDGDVASEEDLDVGQIVIVEGDVNDDGVTGTAQRVTVGIAVAGPISAVNLALKQITALGQTIEIDPSTNIEPPMDDQLLGGLKVGDDLEISGFVNSAGLVTARRITPRQPSTPLKVIGFVTDLDEANQRFSINGLPVDYAAATLSGLSTEDLAGAPVRVTGDGLAPDGTLKAEGVTLRDLSLPGAVGDAAQVQGWVTRFTSESDFAVDGHPVVTTPATKLEGATGADLGIVRLDAFVSVKGTLINDGVVEAELVETNNVVALDSVITYNDGEFVFADLVPWAGPGCHLDSTTAIAVDGLTSTADALQVGDVATIYAHFFGNILEGTAGATCQIIAVEHNVRGPVESKATDSASMMVMGQRVWFDSAYPITGLDGLAVGDMVEVSGHTTAEGDILASGIHVANGATGYRVIGFTHELDIEGNRFALGDLLIDYTDATVGGFPDGALTNGQRVLVTAATAPSDGLLRADVVRYAADKPRGSYANFVTPVGLITRYAAPDDLDVEGRQLIRLEHQVDEGVWVAAFCDTDKLHPNLRATFFSVGNVPASPPLYWTAQCPPGRRRDEAGPASFTEWPQPPLEVHGIVEAIDLERRSVQVAGVNLMLHPATLLTRFQESTDLDGTGVTTPAFLEDLTVGESAWVQVRANPATGIRVVGAIWLNDAAATDLPDDEVWIESTVKALANPDVILFGDIHLGVDADTQIRRITCSGTTYTPAEFFSTFTDPGALQTLSILARKASNGLVAESITWDEGCWEDSTYVEAGPDQTVTSGALVYLTGSFIVDEDAYYNGSGNYSWSWEQVEGPTVALTEDQTQSQPRASFTAPTVSDPVDLIFELTLYADEGTGPSPIGSDTVTIRVEPSS